MAVIGSSRRSPAQPPEHAKSTSSSTTTRAFPPSLSKTEKQVNETNVKDRAAHKQTPPPPLVTSTSAPSAVVATSDATALLKDPLVRDLVRENEAMLIEIALLRQSRTQVWQAQLQSLLRKEEAARAALLLAEAGARRVGVSLPHSSFLTRRVVDLELSLADEEAEKAELRSFAELAQAQLDSSLRHRPSDDATTPSRHMNRASDEAGSRRHSLQEITNARGSVKRLRSVESSECGTPRDGRRGSSSGQLSPGAITTKVRKTMH